MKHGILAILIGVCVFACGQEETIVREVITTEVSVPVTGETGANGSSCEITESTTASYITCNGKTTQIVDGRDGANGIDGTTPTDNDVDLNVFYRERIGSVPKIEAYRKLADGTLQKQWHGSGVVVAQDVVVTNYHVCQNLNEFVTSDHGYTNTIKVSYPYANSDGVDQDFEVSYFTTKFVTSIDRDLCLLQVPTGNRTVFEMMPSDEVGIMDKLMSIGYPLEFDFVGSVGYAETITTGIYPWIATDTTIIQTSSLIDGGNSGGPSFHVKSGKIVGINFGVYRYYNTHAHMLAMEYVQAMSPATATFRDADAEVLDLNAMIKTQVFSATGFLDNTEPTDGGWWVWDQDVHTFSLNVGDLYWLQTTQVTGINPLEGTYFYLQDPYGNYVYDMYFKGKFAQSLFTPSASGTYTLYMETYSWEDAGNYRVTVSKMQQTTGGPYVGSLTAQFSSNNPNLHMFVNPSNWTTGWVSGNVTIQSGTSFTANARIDTDTSYADNAWLDQLVLSGVLTTTMQMHVVECGMTWNLAVSALLVSNGVGGNNFIPHIEAYDLDSNGIIDSGTCVLKAQNGTIIPAN
ncbi:trypsin-like peptidase domain-containing protein [Candidatus Falkowbacteria bacterium]|nr:trypsin-like peptidase domain-containing protein [Candidatus Falkowbacteria bacterium]